jgi:acid phosphatase (class A)
VKITSAAVRQFSSAAVLLTVFWAMPAAALSDTPYLAPGSFDVIHLLPPPPVSGSPAEQRDVEAVVQLQKASSPERMKLAEKDATNGLNAFQTVLSPSFELKNLPIVAAFFGKVGRDVQFATAMGKDCWERPRPFVLDSRVHPPGMMKEQTLNRPGEPNTAPHDPASPCPPLMPAPAYSYSYPSGHSTFGAMSAILLADMVPEKRSELYTRGWQFGESRIVGGVHYPSDVEAGRIDATAMVAVMMLNRDFQSDLAAARAELRTALGLKP